MSLDAPEYGAAVSCSFSALPLVPLSFSLHPLVDRFSDLDTLLDHIWTYVADASTNAQHPFRTPTFGTVGTDAPRLRTVVLRTADREARMLGFHTDRRSQKIEQIRGTPRIVWQGWDPERSEQFRLRGTASIHTDDDVADALWTAASDEERRLYRRPTAPGTPTEAPEHGLDESAPGRPHFAAIRTVIDEINWLHLHPDGHYRAHFRYHSVQNDWDGQWIVP